MLKITLNCLIFLHVFKEMRCAFAVTKVVCTAIDPKFSNFQLCEVTPNEKKIRGMSLNIQLLQLPVTNCQMHVEIVRPMSPKAIVVVNKTWDACEFMRNPNKYRALNRLYSYVGKFSNINHSCPYNHDLIITNATFDFPFPAMNGDYYLRLYFVIDNQKRLSIDITLRSNI